MSTINRLRDDDPRMYGTFRQGEVTASYADLVAALGQPAGPSGDGKVDAEWVVERDGVVATIYNYKNGPAYGEAGSVEVITDWHIGGRDRAAVDVAMAAIKSGVPSATSDRDAIDAIANILCEPEWDVGVPEWIADVIGRVRPHPGGRETRDEYARLFVEATGRDVIEGDRA